ncbi:MAG: UDP-glucose 4-epimerase GalE [Clostridia bacterium]|nr:UDP-glucose 4-epimerase GalE [Clostridia bacterium]
MRILVTGGAGFIGSHTVVELLKDGHDVVIIDNFVNSSPEALKAIRQISGRDFDFVEGDLRDRAAVKSLFDGTKVDSVIHFAGLKAVGESVRKPLEYYENNLGGFFVLADEMRRHGVKKIVFSSSATVYGMNNPVPFREEMPTSATNPYGYTKVMIEQMLRDLAASDPEWRICMLRYFNPIGAHPSGLIGENPSGIPNNLFPYITQVATGKLDQLHVFGNDYPTVDGTGVRDYIHVVDLALGHIAALDYIEKHSGAAAINLGTGRGTSVLELVHAFERACGRKIPYRVDPRREGDIAECYADTSLAAEQLGWKARFGVDDMCRDGWNFAKRHS